MGVIRHMDHFTVVTKDLKATLSFYEKLGLVPGARPNFGMGGAWLYAGGKGHPILHIVENAKPPEPPVGVLDHMAFRADDLSGTLALLKAQGIEIKTLVKITSPVETWQIFFNGPSGEKVELDFDGTEKAPDGYPVRMLA